jgi:hypothetical protein
MNAGVYYSFLWSFSVKRGNWGDIQGARYLLDLDELKNVGGLWGGLGSVGL